MAEMKFEDALKRLEKIVGELEDGSLSLDEALERYEEGIRLSRLCEKRLEAAKKRVEILVKSEDGSIELKPFDEKAAAEEDGTKADSSRKKKAREEDIV